MSKGINHENRAHALLSASGAARWLNCTPSARLEENYGEKKTSVYAAEGTLAHELGEVYLRKDLTGTPEEEFQNNLDKIMNDQLFSDEMLDVVPIYVDYCEALVAEAKTRCNGLASFKIEAKLDLSEFVPGSFGTGDFCCCSNEILDIVDYKHGKGVPVYSEWNPQLMLYGVGALRLFDTMYDIKTVRMTIVQPRINNINTFEISVDELLDWAENYVKPRALMADKGEGEVNPGDWCRFCGVKTRCRALCKQQLEIAKYDFKEGDLLTDEEVIDVIERTPRLVEWANAVSEYAQRKALAGKEWPGYKLVEGISRRKWIADEDKAVQTLFERCPELGEDEVYDMKLRSITAMEKSIGKKRFEELFSDIVVKPQGKPTLVPLSDKRPAMGVEQAKLDFAE